MRYIYDIVKKNVIISTIFVFLLMALCTDLIGAAPAWATQKHGDPEGLLVHQIAHIFFAITMALLVYWLRSRNLTIKSGWRFIQYAAVLLVVWNVDAFLVHMLDEASGLLHIKRVGNWHIQIVAENADKTLEVLYYLAKLDHLWCVPALALLYFGLRRLAAEACAVDQKADRP